MIKNIILFLLRSFLKVYNRIEVIGLENIPASGPLIIAANHLSNIDPPALVSYASKARRIHVLAKKELFKFRPFGAFLEIMDVFPIDRHRAGGDMQSLKRSLKILKGNGCLFIFPEGTRAKGRNLKPKSGMAFMAHKTGAAVLPVRIFNSDNSLKLGKITIKFGNVKTFKAEDFSDIKKAYSDFSENLMKNIYSITKE